MQAEKAVLQGQILEIEADDGVLIRAQVHGQADATRLIVSHGNGLAAGGYASFWRGLASEYQIVLLDFRGHGLSDRGSPENHSWSQFQQDFDTVMRAIPATLGARKTYGVFHSLSAIVSMQHARRFGPACDGFVLFDPPVIPPDDHPMQAAHIDEMMNLASRVGKRRAYFDSWRDLAAQYRRNPMFARCQPNACDEMAHALLRPVSSNEGNWTLSCAPDQEAKIFASNDDTTLWSWLGQAGLPLKLICADPDVPGVQPSAAIDRDLALRFGLDYACVPGTTHFLQLEQPGLCASLTREFCK